MASTFNMNKYRKVTVAIVIFFVVMLLILSLNFYIARESGVQARQVYVAGQQWMLSQRIAKSLLNTSEEFQLDEDYSQSYEELRSSVETFQRALDAFIDGGYVIDDQGEEQWIPAIDSEIGSNAAQQTLILWRPFKQGLDELGVKFNDLSNAFDEYEASSLFNESAAVQQTIRDRDPIAIIREKVDEVLFAKEDTRQKLKENIDYSQENINKILEYIGILSNDIEQTATNTAYYSRLLQILGILLVTCIFIYIAYSFFGQIRLSDLKADQARQETQQIMSTVDHGLILLDKNAVIGNQYSKKMHEIFPEESISGNNFVNFVEKFLSKDDSEQVDRFLRLLFDPHKKQELLEDLNPLHQISFRQRGASGKALDKHLKFSFSRIYEDNNIERVLASIDDITTEIELSQELERETQRGKQQADLLGSIIRVDKALLAIFIQKSKERFQKANTILRNKSGQFSDYKKNAYTLESIIHAVKGESASLSLDMIVDLCNNFEEQVADLLTQTEISGNDFLKLTVILDQLIQQNNMIHELYKKIYSVSLESTSSVDENNYNWDHLHNLCAEVSERQDKKVNLSLAGLDSPLLTSEMVENLNTISTQLIRNSIVHGIESESERVSVNKKDAGQISISLFHVDDTQFSYVYKDDGAGIDLSQLLERAIDRELVTQEESESMSDKQIAQLIFRPGMSTTSEADTDSGRGVGMSAVYESIEDLNGSIKMVTKKGRGTAFKIVFSRS
jgi:two-component sensor histidine kinase